MENVKRFYEALSNDEGMKARASALNGKYEGKEVDEASVAADIAAFAKSEGFEFTAAELTEYAKTEGKELSDDELNAVAGGAYNPKTCFCAVGGGGKDERTGDVCVCVASGGGIPDGQGRFLFCILGGGVF